jgi:hypothetical protein
MLGTNKIMAALLFFLNLCGNCTSTYTDFAPPSVPIQAVAANDKKWECDTCMVMNEPSITKCVCCTAEKRVITITAPAAVTQLKDGR